MYFVKMTNVKLKNENNVKLQFRLSTEDVLTTEENTYYTIRT